MAPTLDFLIPARNAEATLVATLASLRAQTTPSWRAIIIDDGSTDGTARVAESVSDFRIRLQHGPAAGVAAARNRAFAASSADLVCFLDADDVIAPRFIEAMTAGLGQADVIACAYAYAGPGLEPSGWIITPGPDDHLPARLAELNPFSIGALVFRRETLARLGQPLFPTDSHHEDWELLLRLASTRARWAGVVAEPLFTYRLRPDSRTTDLRAMWLGGLSVIERHHPERGSVRPAQRRWTLRSLARAIIREDHHLAGEMLARLAGLTSADEGTLAGAFRWALRREVVSGSMTDPGPAGLAAVLKRFLPGGRAERLAARAADPAVYWSRVARAAAARLAPGQQLVVYGMGRNGTDLARQLAALPAPFSWIDDYSPERADTRRISAADLGPGHAVVLTPDERGALESRLKRTGAMIWLPEHLAAPSLQGCAA